MTSRPLHAHALRAALLLAALALPAMKSDPLAEAKAMWVWTAPAAYPQPFPGTLDLGTLSALLDAGNLQWYWPRPEAGAFDALVAVKVHAPAAVLWRVVSDYPGYCRLLSETYRECAVDERRGPSVRTHYRAQTSVIKFSFDYDAVEEVTEDPPHGLVSRAVSGGMAGAETAFYLVPLDDHSTLLVARYYPHLAALGFSVKSALAIMPMLEWPMAAAAANYALRGFRAEAERLSGYARPAEPAPLQDDHLQPDTLRALERASAGLIRETASGKTLHGIRFVSVVAPAAVVWQTLADFDRYQDFREGDFILVKKTGDQVWLRQKSHTFSILIFTFGEMDLVERYTLTPPDHLAYDTVEGLYAGSSGYYHVLPAGEGAILFHSLGLNLARDDSLTMRIVQSGAFPADTMMFLTAAGINLRHVKAEAERRARAAP